MISKKQIEDKGKAQYAKWRANQNKLNLLKGIIDETSNDRLQELSVRHLATP